MRIRFMLRSLLVLALLLAAPASAAPEVGERAPDFRFLGEGRREVRFEDYFGGTAGSEAKADDVGSATGVAGETAGEGGGRRGVVIAWFPKAFTPGWTTELAALRDSASQIAAYDVDVLYVSLDSPEKNAEFAAAMGTQIPVLSDPKGETARRYGVLKLGGLYASRWTFYIGADSRLLEIDKDVRPASAGEDMLRTLERLGFERSSSEEETADSR